MPPFSRNDAQKVIGQSFHHRNIMQKGKNKTVDTFHLTIASLNVEEITQNKQDLIS